MAARMHFHIGFPVAKQLLLCVGLLAASTSMTTAEPKAGVTPTIQDRIAVARASGDHAQVISLADRLLEEQPQSTDALVFRGFAYLSAGDLEAAERDFRTTLRLAPDYLDATLGLAYVSLRRGETATAEMLAREVVDADDGYEEARELLELVQRQAGAERRQESNVPPVASRSETAVAENPTANQRTFSVDGGQAWGDREDREFTLTFADIERAGLRMVYGLRHTERQSGDATQISLRGFWAHSLYTLGGELAIGTGADNLAQFRIGASVSKVLPNGLEFGTEIRWESFASSRIVTVIPIATYHFGPERAKLSLRAPTSFTSETNGFANVIDARLRLPLGQRLDLGVGHSTGEEFDAATKREVRSTSIGLIVDLKGGLRVAATLSDGPYADTDQTNLNAAVVWSF